MIKGTVDDQVSEFFDVPRSNGNPVGQAFCENVRNSDLVDGDVRIRRDDGSASKVDSLAHHVHPKEALLSFNKLLQAPTRVRRR